MTGPATLGWLDLTAADRDKVSRVLDLFREQGTVDELGLGSIRDVISNTLFPGTSVLHTRLRYALFIPWIYQSLESRGRGQDVGREARRLEVELIDALSEGDDTAGIIGKRARENLAQLPSTAYWALLTHWGLFIPGRSKSWYHTHFDGLLSKRADMPRSDDPGVVWDREPTWHPRLPSPPDGFPTRTTFALTRDESDFLLGRIQTRCAGSLLAWLAQRGTSGLGSAFWNEEIVEEASADVRDGVELARRTSLHLEGAPLLYNLLLAELRHARKPTERDEKLSSGYRDELDAWAARETVEDRFNPHDIWRFALKYGGTTSAAQKRFVEAWSARIAEIGADRVVGDGFLRELVSARERQLKGPRARTTNEGRLLDWSGRVGVGRMDFRWLPHVRQLLVDLHTGLGR